MCRKLARPMARSGSKYKHCSGARDWARGSVVARPSSCLAVLALPTSQVHAHWPITSNTLAVVSEYPALCLLGDTAIIPGPARWEYTHNRGTYTAIARTMLTATF